MTRKMTRMLLVVVTALTLAVGALGMTGGLGSGWATPEVSAIVVQDSCPDCE
jgi:hypothetical protein